MIPLFAYEIEIYLRDNDGNQIKHHQILLEYPVEVEQFELGLRELLVKLAKEESDG